MDGDDGQADDESASEAAEEVESDGEDEAKKWKGGREAVTAPLCNRERPRRAGDTTAVDSSVSGDRKDEADQRSAILTACSHKTIVGERVVADLAMASSKGTTADRRQTQHRHERADS